MSFFQNSSIFLYFYLWNQIWNLDFTRYLSCFTKTFLKTFQCWQCKSGKIGKKLVCGNKRFCCIYSRCHNNSSYICYFAISYWERFKHCKLQQKFIQNTIFFFCCCCSVSNIFFSTSMSLSSSSEDLLAIYVSRYSCLHLGSCIHEFFFLNKMFLLLKVWGDWWFNYVMWMVACKCKKISGGKRLEKQLLTTYVFEYYK